MASYRCGQTALLSLPPPADDRGNDKTSDASSIRVNVAAKIPSVAGYPLPASLQVERKSLTSGAQVGIEVLKLSKNAKVQSRRIAFSPNHRSLLLTSKKVKSFKGLWKLKNNEPSTANVIDLSQIDHIYKGHMCKRFQNVFDPLSSSGSHQSSSHFSPISSTYTAGTSLADAEATSLSIVYRDASQNDAIESLDLIVPDPKDYSHLITALEDLLEVCRDEQRYYDRDLLILRHHWIALERDFDDGISASEFDKLCQRCNVPLKKSTTNALFKEHMKELKKNYEIEDMPIWAVQNIMKDVKHLSNEQAGVKYLHHDPLLRIWHDILASDPVPFLGKDQRGGGDINGPDMPQSLEIGTSPTNNNHPKGFGQVINEKTISSVAFLSFIRSQQKEFGCTLEKALQLMQTINSQTSSRDLAQEHVDLLSSPHHHHHQAKGFGCDSPTTTASSSDQDEPDSKGENRLTKSRLFGYLFSDANDILDPSRGKVGADDMKQPLSSYWINASHDTYWNHSIQQMDEQMYLAALYRGVRCLDLDVWDGPNGKPVLAREEPELSSSGSSGPSGGVDGASDSSTAASNQGGDDHGGGAGRNSGSGGTKYLDVTVALKAIRQFLLANPKSYPVILNLENHCSFCVQERLANQIFTILGSIGLIVVPDDSDSVDEADLLPSPASMRGKVLIMGKRPAIIQDGAKIVNDDYDDENTAYVDDYLPNAKSREEEDFEATARGEDAGVVIGFDARGPIRSTNPSVVRHSPGELLFMAKQELEQAKIDAAEAEMKASDLHGFAVKAEAHSDKLIEKAGLDKDSIWDLADEVKTPEIDPVEHVKLLSRSEGEGVEIQEFFADAVEGARTGYAAADQEAIAAAEKATVAIQRLNQTTSKLRDAEDLLERAYMKEQNLTTRYQRAAADARSKREHADQAERRIAKVKQLLKECQTSANSAENVVVTAMTEAKISEKRAVETEARAARASATAQSERQKAEEETRREEELEKQATALHEKVTIISSHAKESREKMEKASAMLDRVNEQIKLIESSSQYVRERQAYLRYNPGREEKKDSSNKRFPKGKVLQKHEDKLEERRLYALAMTDASAEAAKIEAKMRTAQESFEKCAHLWKTQTEVASRARKQADRSTQLAEELAEHAEEEREAANLRHIARERAKNNVAEKDAYKASLKAQLSEAQRGRRESERIAEEARISAEEFAAAAEAADPHDDLVRMMEKRRAARDHAREEYEAKKKLKDECDLAAEEAKRLFATSENVYSEAMRNAAKDARKADVQLVADQNAIVAFNRSRLASKQADHAFERARYVQGIVEEKNIYAKRAMEYKERMDKITEIPASLAKMTFLHTTKFKYWEKSLDLPNTHSHSFSQPVLAQMVERDADHPKRLKEFAADHLCRTFPNRKVAESDKVINSDPLFQWASGCQIVSMNYSVFDEHILKAEGRFRRNGSSGYVLKPDSLLNYEDAVPERPEAWTMSVLCGSCIPSPDSKRGNSSSAINPFVILTVYGGAMQSKSASHRTRMVHKNGFNPIWDDKKGFTFKATTPSTSILVFQVYDKHENGNEEFIAAASVPVSCIREGYRSVALFDKHHSRAGAHAHASLLVRAQKLTN